MDSIFNWILDDILKAIQQLGFTAEEAPLPNVHAVTNADAGIVIYNPQSVTLFEMSEELQHAKDKHHRKWREYDARNPQEKEAHLSGLKFLLERWVYYCGSDNWLTFVTVTGTPDTYEDFIIDAFKNNEDKIATYWTGA